MMMTMVKMMMTMVAMEITMLVVTNIFQMEMAEQQKRTADDDARQWIRTMWAALVIIITTMMMMMINSQYLEVKNNVSDLDITAKQGVNNRQYFTTSEKWKHK